MVNLQQFLRNLNTIGEARDPVRNLWRNVLIVALEDALGKALPEIADATNTFKGQFEGQLKDQLGGLKDVGSKIDTNALQDQLKRQLSQNSIKNIIRGLNI